MITDHSAFVYCITTRRIIHSRMPDQTNGKEDQTSNNGRSASNITLEDALARSQQQEVETRAPAGADDQETAANEGRADTRQWLLELLNDALRIMDEAEEDDDSEAGD